MAGQQSLCHEPVADSLQSRKRTLLPMHPQPLPHRIFMFLHIRRPIFAFRFLILAKAPSGANAKPSHLPPFFHGLLFLRYICKWSHSPDIHYTLLRLLARATERDASRFFHRSLATQPWVPLEISSNRSSRRCVKDTGSSSVSCCARCTTVNRGRTILHHTFFHVSKGVSCTNMAFSTN